MPKCAEDSDFLKHLQKHGPTVKSEMPYGFPTANVRNQYTRRFTLKSGEIVFYLPEEHSRLEVLREWRENNEEVVEEQSERTLQICLGVNHPEAWKEAGREVFGPFDNWAGNPNLGDGMGGTCALCGEDYDSYLRNHLPCDS